jgi:two-component system sensor histidine kinase HydH
VVTSFLRDKARFVEYLNSIDLLQLEELTALARETGLLGIGLVQTAGEVIVGPPDWLPEATACSLTPNQVHYNQDNQTALLIYPGTQQNIRCIQIGLDASAIVQLRNKTALPVLLATLSRLPGIHYVRLEVIPAETTSNSLRLLTQDGIKTTEARLKTPMGTLVVGLDAANHLKRLEQLWRQFSLFASLLLLLGLFFSWLLYRYQQKDINQTRTFERLLAKEHEAAALGRATATIAHEVRNPLNAINMGLQRLTLESPDLSTDQRELISAMEEAVRRAGTIITELQRFTRKLQPLLQPVDLGQILRQILTLYQSRCAAQQIEIAIEQTFDGNINADSGLLSELVDNLLKNSVEAQTEGGFIHIDLSPVPTGIKFTVINGGCTLTAEDMQRLGEPYFTTKARGTGLGLALCRRIVEAHGGELDFLVDPSQQHLTVAVTLPLTAVRHNENTTEASPATEKTIGVQQ